jgi:MerR family transcriptional regulator, light-induced transcriptional regulator
MGQYSIRDIEVLSGVKAHTLRIWEQRYDFLKPNRTDTNIRFYDDEQLKLILNISALNRSGMKISKIACLCNEDLCKEVERLSEVNPGQDTILDSFIRAMIDFDEARFEKALSCSIMKHGFVNTFSELLFPMMARTGVLWSTGAIRPAQEHFISNLIRRKLLAAIDNQFVQKTAQSRRFVLFLPEGETHELTLLFTEYVLREHNHEVVYLGNSVPFEDIEFISQAYAPQYLVTYITVPIQQMGLQQYINNLAGLFPAQTVICGGKQFKMQNVKLPSNASLIYNSHDLLEVIA